MVNVQKPVSFERMLRDLRPLLESLAMQHRFWEIRIHGGQGMARVEVIYQMDSYRYEVEGSEVGRIR